MSRRQTLLLSCLLFTQLACGAESSGDPAQVTYAPALGVDLTAMEQRPSGLYVLDQVVGTGVEVVTRRYVEVYYTGWLPDGYQFDSNAGTTSPLKFTVGQGSVIAGFDEGMLGMRVGGKRRIIIPSKLGYGERSTAGIPANSVLIFDVELAYAR